MTKASTRIRYFHRWECGDSDKNRYYELATRQRCLNDGIFALSDNARDAYLRFPRLHVVTQDEPVIGALLSLPNVRQVRVDGHRVGILVKSQEDLPVVHDDVIEILRRDVCPAEIAVEVEVMAGKFCIMRAFRSPKPTETDLQAWSFAGVFDTAAAAVAYFFSDSKYWPWESQKDCGVRVNAYVFAPAGSESQPDSAGGAPLLHTPDGEPDLSGAAIMEMTVDDLKARGIIRQFI